MPRDEIRNRREDVLELMRDGKWWTAKEVGERLGVSRQRVFTMTNELREDGHAFEARAGQGTRLVEEKLCAHSSEGEESAKTAPATPPAPAPASITGVPLGTEQPADPVAADSPMVEPPPAAGIVPFAGIVTTTLVGFTLSTELRILADLEDLDDEAYERVMRYTLSKRLLK